jgi:ribosomal protein S20
MTLQDKLDKIFERAEAAVELGRKAEARTLLEQAARIIKKIATKKAL